MKIDKTKISGFQTIFVIVCFFQASSLLSSFLASITKQDSWLIIVFGGLICLPIFWFFGVIVDNFPNKNLFQFFEYVYGKSIGKIISFFYLIFFILLTSLNLSDLTSFSRLTIMSKTPNFVIAAVCIIVSATAVRKGIKVVARYSLVFAVTSFIISIVTFCLLINQFDFSNFLPILSQKPMNYIQATHIFMTIPLGEVVALAMIVPNVSFKKGQIKKFLMVGLALAVFTFLFVNIRDTAVLGNVYHHLQLPPLIALRLVSFGETISRIEILFATALLLLLFFKITLLYYIVVISIAHIFEVENFWSLTMITGAFIVPFSLTIINVNPLIHSSVGQETTPFLWGLLEYVIPALTFLIAILRGKTKSAMEKKRKKQEESSQSQVSNIEEGSL